MEAVPFPRSSLTSFELPVFVKSAGTAVRLLGGATSLVPPIYLPHTTRPPGAPPAPSLPLRLREDPFSHPLEGLRVRTNNLLVRVWRPAGGGEGAPPASVALLGGVGASYRWQGAADFQFLPAGVGPNRVDPRK